MNGYYSHYLFMKIWYPRRESNSNLKFRKLPFYPLNYGGR